MKAAPAGSEEFVFCTIVTDNYLPFAKALHDSLKVIQSNARLIVLVSNRTEAEWQPQILDKGISVVHYGSFLEQPIGRQIYEKYHEGYHDAYRWSMKPVLLLALLERYEKVVYVDCDIHFYSDFRFLFDLLSTSTVLLSPHFRSIDPVADYDNYIMQFNNGIYNGGFVGVSRGSEKALHWWARVCCSLCEISPCKGQFVDQSHLNLMPVYFENVQILTHRGCNVANWNQLECKRIDHGGAITINGRYPIVFIHFTKTTVRGIISGEDVLLRRFLKTYLDRLSQYGISVETILPVPVRTPFLKKLTFQHIQKYLELKLRRLTRPKKRYNF